MGTDYPRIPGGRVVIADPETARQAMETWRLVAEYRLPLDGSFEATEDWAAFAGWSREFRRRCGPSRWLERARLSDFLRDRIAAGEVTIPALVYIAGFDEMTPQQSEFMTALGNWRSVAMPNYCRPPERRRLPDSSAEIRSAAAWARGLLENDPETQIGIIVAPDLTRLRPAVERIFGEVLEARVESADRERAFHLSVGPVLADYPVVRAALLMLEFALGKLPLPRVGMLLRSPFLAGSEKEWGKRAQLDAKLRKKGLWDVSLSRLNADSGSCPELQHVMRRVEKQIRKIPQEQRPSVWSSVVQDLLEAFGWPGDRAPSSHEFQTIAEWRRIISAFAALDITASPMNLEQVIDWLHQQAANARFQVEDEGAPVQVMGMLEATGMRFDHLWIMGLHDEALPAPANPNPFLPTSLQRKHRLPHSTSEGELAFASALMDRLLASSPDVVLSCPAIDGERSLMPTPLVAGGSWLEENEQNQPEWIVRMRTAAVLDEIVDQTGPGLVESGSAGGSSLFKDMAACPFRAFAKHRLAARPLEETDLGLSYRDRGSTVHTALEFIWLELRSQARLIELSRSELQTLVARGADAAIAKLGPGIGRDLEKQRLQRLLSAWLDLERTRSEFTVKDIEDKRVVAMAGIEVQVRADRVDVLPDGREVILDYKTGQLKSHAWEGERPDEPQLPLYCATSGQPVAGAAFAIIRTGELRFRGLTASDVKLPSFTKMSIDPAVAFEEQVIEWRRVLQHLAEAYRAGKADVDPKAGACDNCGLRALCRIREFENGRG